GEAVGDERGDEAAVIQVRVREEQGVDLARREGERQAVTDGVVGVPLEHPAVDEDPRASRGEEELRTGDGGRAAEERQLHGRDLPPASPYSGGDVRSRSARRARHAPTGPGGRRGALR